MRGFRLLLAVSMVAVFSSNLALADNTGPRIVVDAAYKAAHRGHSSEFASYFSGEAAQLYVNQEGMALLAFEQRTYDLHFKKTLLNACASDLTGRFVTKTYEVRVMGDVDDIEDEDRLIRVARVSCLAELEDDEEPSCHPGRLSCDLSDMDDYEDERCTIISMH